MDSLIASLQDAVEAQIDFHGQHLAELISTVLLILTGIVAFVTGYIYQDIYLTLWMGLAGAFLTALVVIPPWPFYNANPERWHISEEKRGNAYGIVVDGVQVGR